MKIKFTELTNLASDYSRSYIGEFTSLFRPSKRKHDYDSNGKKVSLPNPVTLNTIVVNIKNPEGKVRERVVDYLGSKLLLSSWQRREFSPELIKELEKLGQEILQEGSEGNVVINSNTAKVYGNNCFIENSNGVRVYGNGSFVQDLPEAIVKGNTVVLKETDTAPNFRRFVTASDLYSYYVCPHKPWRDSNYIKEKTGKLNDFLKLLWEKGILYEQKVVSEIKDYADLSEGTEIERSQNTIKAMQLGIPLIYHGILMVDEIFGEPDLLQRQADGTYIPIDIKSAMGVEGADEDSDGKLKEYYAWQLGLYADALIRLGFAKEKKGIILDIEGKRVEYDLNLPRNKRDKRSWWEVYQTKKDEVYALIQNRVRNNPALFSGCKMCDHIEACTAWCEKYRDLSLVYKLGRSYRDTIVEDTNIKTIDDLAKANVDELLKEKEEKGGDFLKGIGEGRLLPFIRRAQYLTSGATGVKILNPIKLPEKKIELYFDIEADPTQNFVYLHGVAENKDGNVVYKAFVANELNAKGERQAWKDFWDYIRSLPKDEFSVYHYGVYERVTNNQLLTKYPDVVTREELDNFFQSENTVDLYRIVDRDTDWPLKSYSLKPIAQSLGFKWRDVHPSGAASIMWYNEWLRTKDPDGMKRILEYNEDDCLATFVLKKYLVEEMKKYVSGLEKQLQKPDENKRIPLPLV